MKKSSPPICNYEGSDYQASFWEHGDRDYEDRVEQVALRRLLPPGGELLLELGAGAGRNTARYHGFKRVVLLDYSLTQLQQAQARLGRSPRYIYVAADVYHLPFAAGLFEAATMIRVLHHMADAPGALQQVHQALQPGGVFILEFANKLNLKAILRYALRRQSWSPFNREPVEFTKLNFDFHPAAVRRWLDEIGFKLERQLTVSHFRIGWIKRIFPVGLLVAADSLAQRTGDWWQLSPSVFTRSRAIHEASSRSDGNGFFVCIDCKDKKLEEQPQAMVCPACGRSYPIRDGIYDFR